MLTLETPIVERISTLPALAGWEVRTGTQPEDRRNLPAFDVRCTGAAVTDSKAGAAMVAPVWTITVMARRGPLAAEQLDSAFAAIFATLHNWRAGPMAGRGWEPLRLVRATAPVFTDNGTAGLELEFTTGARYETDNN